MLLNPKAKEWFLQSRLHRLSGLSNLSFCNMSKVIVNFAKELFLKC